MNNYRVQHGCRDCAHVFKAYEYDCDTEFYCTLNAPKRPKCMSVAMDGEMVHPIGGPEYSAAHEAWDAWSEGRKVTEAGICDSWQAQPAAEEPR